MKKALSFFGWPLLVLPTLILWTGMTMNEIAVHANQGRMPVYAADCQQLMDAQPDGVHKCMTPDSRAKIFGDILVSNEGIASIGDILQDFSGEARWYCLLLWASMAVGCVIRKEKFHL